MNLKSLFPRPWLALIFVALILITRTNANNAIINPPDATLAVFFLAGLCSLGLLTFGVLFVACVAADLLSFALGISAWCFTPAYVFLVPTYAALWYAGYFCRTVQVDTVPGAVKAAAALALASVVAYVISTYSFFWFSGQIVSERQIAAYEASILNSFPHYVGWAFFYTVFCLMVALIVRSASPKFWAKLSGRSHS